MSVTRKFADRTEAGKQLGEALRARHIEPDIVLAIPRGGLPLGRAVADILDVPLDIVVASKISAPGNPELAIGAVASDGSVWRNEDALYGTGATDEYFEQERKKEAENARQKEERYRNGGSSPELVGKTVVVVDDGVATGSTARACLKMLRETGADSVILAIPVGPPDTVTELQQQTDDVICLETPKRFMGVGEFYEHFRQVPDDEAMTYLERET